MTVKTWYERMAIVTSKLQLRQLSWAGIHKGLILGKTDIVLMLELEFQ